MGPIPRAPHEQGRETRSPARCAAARPWVRRDSCARCGKSRRTREGACRRRPRRPRCACGRPCMRDRGPRSTRRPDTTGVMASGAMISRQADPTHPFRCGTQAGFPSPAAARGVTMRAHEASFRQKDGTQETGAIHIPDSHMARRRDWSGAARVGHLPDRGCGVHRQGHRRRELFRADVEREEERSPGGESRTLLVRMRDDAGAMRVHRHDVPAARAEHAAPRCRLCARLPGTRTD